MRILLCGLVAALFAHGCGGQVYVPSRGSGFEMDPAFEINDQDIAKAFAARPQLDKTYRVAYYSFAPERAKALGEMILGLPNVELAYHLPSLLVTGQRRPDEGYRYGYYGHQSPPKFSIKKLRLLAARSRCDLVLIVDKRHRVEDGPNGWVVLNILVLPVLFVPFLDVEVHSALDAYLIDTRNGYLYAHISADAQGGEDTVTVWNSVAAEQVESQWTKLLGDAREQLSKLLTDPSLQAAPVPAAPAAPKPIAPTPGVLLPGPERINQK